MWLVPLSDREALEAIKRAYGVAQQYARKVGGRAEPIQPRHIYGQDAGYSLRVGQVTPPLHEAAVAVIWGFYNADEYFDYVRFIQGGRQHEWFVEPVAYYPGRVGVWLDEPLVFHGGFTIEAHTTSTEPKERVYGWPLGYVASPLQPPQPVRAPTRGRERRRIQPRRGPQPTGGPQGPQ